jgi:hypothetical protein
MRQRSAGYRFMLRPVRLPPVVLFPRHLASIGVQVLAADVVVLT